MKTLLLLMLAASAVSAHANCVINTESLYANKTVGARKIESILRAKGYEVVSQKDQASDYTLEVRYYGNQQNKILHMMVWNGYPSTIFEESEDYQTPFGFEGTIFEKITALKMARKIPECRNF